MEFFKVFNIGEDTILVRKSTSIEPNQTITQQEIVAMPCVCVHFSIVLDGESHFIDKFYFCCMHNLDKIYNDTDEKFCTKLIEETKVHIDKAMKQIKYGIREN